MDLIYFSFFMWIGYKKISCDISICRNFCPGNSDNSTTDRLTRVNTVIMVAVVIYNPTDFLIFNIDRYNGSLPVFF